MSGRILSMSGRHAGRNIRYLSAKYGNRMTLRGL